MKVFIILSFMTFTAHAGTNAFCDNPIQFTCGQQTDDSREDRIEQIEHEIKTQAFQDMSKQSDVIAPGLNLKDYDELDQIEPKKVRFRLQKIFYSYVRVHFAAYLKDNLMPSDIGFNQLKSELALIISTDPILATDKKNAIMATLNATQLISLHSDIDDTSMNDVINVFKQCSKGKFEDNAFATEIKHQKVIIVCPGEIIGSIEFIKAHKINPKYSYVPLIMTLGHELSHHFDYRYYPDLYSPILQDIQNQSTQLSAQPENYMSEITADSWGLKVTKKVLSQFSNLPIYPTLLSSTMGDLCETDDDGVHPSGDFRIGYLASKYLCH